MYIYEKLEKENKNFMIETRKQAIVNQIIENYQTIPRGFKENGVYAMVINNDYFIGSSNNSRGLRLRISQHKSIIKQFYNLYLQKGLDYLINHPKYRSMYLYLKILKVMIENNISNIKEIKFYLIHQFKKDDPILNKVIEYKYIKELQSSLYGLNSCIINELKFRIDNKHLYTNINNYTVSEVEIKYALSEIKDNLEEIKTDNSLKSDPVILFNYHNAYINVCECMYKLYFKNFFTIKEINNEIKDLYTQIKELFLCIN